MTCPWVCLDRVRSILQTLQRKSYWSFPWKNSDGNLSRVSFSINPKYWSRNSYFTAKEKVFICFLIVSLILFLSHLSNTSCSNRFPNQIDVRYRWGTSNKTKFSGDRSWIFSTTSVRTFIQSFLDSITTCGEYWPFFAMLLLLLAALLIQTICDCLCLKHLSLLSDMVCLVYSKFLV